VLRKVFKYKAHHKIWLGFMKNKNLIASLFIVILLTASCATQQQTAPTSSKPSVINQPAGQPAVARPTGAISDEVKQLLEKSKTRINNIYYKYKGPETGDNYYDFYIKGVKIKYLPARKLQALDQQDSYNSIYIDATAKTAQSYCDDRACIYKGKKSDLNYNNAYILTILDWSNGVTQADKVGEEVIDDRTTWKVQTNEGTLWLDTFYGIPLKIISDGKTYRFQQLNVNGVQDSDVNPSS